MTSATKWQRPGFISLLDEIERRGRERYGAEWPLPPTEGDIRAVGEAQFENVRRNHRPSGGPALPGDGLRDFSSEALIGKTLDDFMGPDLRTVGDEPLAKLLALNYSQTIRRNNIGRELHYKYIARRREMAVEFMNEIRSELFQGEISAIYENGLRDVEIDRMWWRLPEAEAAFTTGRHAGFEIFLKVEVPAAKAPSVAKIGDETKAQASLVEVMTKYPEKPQGMTNEALFADVKKLCPNLSKRAFDRAKAAAIEKTGAVDWKTPGR